MRLHRPSASTLATLAVTAIPVPLHMVGAGPHGHQVRSHSSDAAGATTPATTAGPGLTTTVSVPGTTTTTGPAKTTSTPSTASAPSTSSSSPGAGSTRQSSSHRVRHAPSWGHRSTKRAGAARHDLVLKAGRRRAHAAGDPGDTISDFKFSPASITIHVGDTITWTNNGPTDHTATASNGSFDTGTLKKGASASHTFTQAGTIAYICSLHPFMHGTVVVLASASSATPAPSTSGTSTPSSSSSSPTTSAAQPAASTGGGSTLPLTGLDLMTTVLAGAVLVGAGIALRRRGPRRS